MTKANRGLTLTEVMVSLALLAIGVLVFAAMQSFFASDTQNRFIYGCLTTSASNALALCLSGQPVSSSIQCGGTQVNISQSGICQPTNSCNTVIFTASYRGFSYQESDYACPNQ